MLVFGDATTKISASSNGHRKNMEVSSAIVSQYGEVSQISSSLLHRPPAYSLKRDHSKRKCRFPFILKGNVVFHQFSLFMLVFTVVSRISVCHFFTHFFHQLSDVSKLVYTQMMTDADEWGAEHLQGWILLGIFFGWNSPGNFWHKIEVSSCQIWLVFRREWGNESKIHNHVYLRSLKGQPVILIILRSEKVGRSILDDSLRDPSIERAKNFEVAAIVSTCKSIDIECNMCFLLGNWVIFFCFGGQPVTGVYFWKRWQMRKIMFGWDHFCKIEIPF